MKFVCIVLAYSLAILFYGVRYHSLYWGVSVFMSCALLWYIMICKCVTIFVRLVTELNGGCENFRISGRKGANVWISMAIAQKKIAFFTRRKPPSGNGNYCFKGNTVPRWTTSDEETNLKTCTICEHEIQLPSYCN